MTQLKSPWTPEQVAALQAFQDAGFMHPFTCPNDNHSTIGNFVPTVRGWVCQFCDYTQDWAHEHMFQKPVDPMGTWREAARIERIAQSLARCEMMQALGDAGVMAISPEILERTFRNAWDGTTEHDERCRKRCRDTAVGIIVALDRADA